MITKNKDLFRSNNLRSLTQLQGCDAITFNVLESVNGILQSNTVDFDSFTIAVLSTDKRMPPYEYSEASQNKTHVWC